MKDRPSSAESSRPEAYNDKWVWRSEKILCIVSGGVGGGLGGG